MPGGMRRDSGMPVGMGMGMTGAASSPYTGYGSGLSVRRDSTAMAAPRRSAVGLVHQRMSVVAEEPEGGVRKSQGPKGRTTLVVPPTTGPRRSFTRDRERAATGPDNYGTAMKPRGSGSAPLGSGSNVMMGVLPGLDSIQDTWSAMGPPPAAARKPSQVAYNAVKPSIKNLQMLQQKKGNTVSFNDFMKKSSDAPKLAVDEKKTNTRSSVGAPAISIQLPI